MDINIEKWLDAKVNDEDILEYNEINEYTIPHYTSKYKKDVYYGTNDIDDVDSVYDVDSEMNNYMDHVLIYPNTNRYHANMLFRQLIDYSIDNNFMYDIYDAGLNEHKSYTLLNKTFKESFYKFCYMHSKK
jgi:hypothetical protein